MQKQQLEDEQAKLLNDLPLNDSFKETRQTYYSAHILKNDSNDYDYYYERTLEDLSAVTGVNEVLLKAAMILTTELWPKYIEWGIYDENNTAILAFNHQYGYDVYNEVRKAYFDLFNKN